MIQGPSLEIGKNPALIGTAVTWIALVLPSERIICFKVLNPNRKAPSGLIDQCNWGVQCYSWIALQALVPEDFGFGTLDWLTMLAGPSTEMLSNATESLQGQATTYVR